MVSSFWRVSISWRERFQCFYSIERCLIGCRCICQEIGISSLLRTIQFHCIAGTILSKSRNFATNHTLQETHRYVVDALNAIVGLEVQYFAIVDGNTLQELKHWSDSDYVVGCITVFCGSQPIRLIDHIKYKG